MQALALALPPPLQHELTIASRHYVLELGDHPCSFSKVEAPAKVSYFICLSAASRTRVRVRPLSLTYIV